ncbi:MAG: RagB/SusD family nutrient uptake outer membrane protein [Alistipes sp.]|jgi:hypothetical protein|nr:RagB/SusD family nutrient uptake outer membrane protein [Alistipes sp.]
MKNIKQSAIVIAVAVLSLTSCGEKFLTVTPPTSMMYVDYYRTEAHITNALVAAYAPLLWESYSWGYALSTFLSDVMGDDLYPGGPHADDNINIQRLEDFSISALVQPDGWWTIAYSGINRCQHVIENIDKVEEISDALRARIRAEALFLRSYYYYQLWRFWGNIPYYEMNLVSPYSAPQLPADKVYDACVATLDGIISSRALPETVPTAELGRATHAAAQMLKARFVMLQMDSGRFGEVLDDMLDIIAKNHHTLKTTSILPDKMPFEELFMREGEWSSETIFDINHTDFGSLTNWNSPPAAGGSVFPRFIGPRELSSNTEFEAGWGFATIPVATYNMYDDADTRKDGGILNFDKWAAAYATRWSVPAPTRGYYPYYQVTGYYLKKYVCRVGYNLNIASGVGSGDMGFSNNIRIFRYAETLLNAAELLVRTGGSTSAAQEYFNMVRDRAFASTAHRIDATIDNIMLERRKEFVGEGLRYWDLVRTGQAATVLPGWHSNATANGIPRWLWPIPDAEMNNTAGTPHPLVQNPSY